MNSLGVTRSVRAVGMLAVLAMVLNPLGALAQSPSSSFNPEEQKIDTSPSREIQPSGAMPSADVVTLTIEEAIAVALRRNLNLLIQRFDRATFSLRVGQNLGIYDTNLNAFLFTNSNTSPAATQLDGAATNVQANHDFNLDLRQLTPFGGTANMTFNVFETKTNSVFATVNPAVFMDLDFGFTQPLLRNAGRLVTERGITVARLDSAISQETFELQVITLVQDVVNSYFVLVEARESLVVAEESLALAQELHQTNQVRVDVGTLAPLELVQSEAGIASRDLDIITARFAMEDGEDDLRRLLNFEEGDLWNVRILTVAPSEIEGMDIDLYAAIDQALAGRAEIQSKRLELQSLGIESAFRGNQKMPRLDLQARYGYNGLGGDFILEPGNPESPIDSGGVNDAWRQVQDRDFPGWEIRVDLGIPLQNRDAKSRSAIADLNVERGEAELDDLEQQVRTEVRKAVRAVRTASQAYRSALVSRRLEERNYEAEQKRFENGLSTSFLVLQIQEDLTSARRVVVDSISSYRRSVADYYRSIGQLLEISNVHIVDSVREDEAKRGYWY